MGKLFFSAEGRISSAEFIRGAVILLALNFFLWPIWFLGSAVGMIAALIGVVTIYCWCCLFSKRFHDSGKTGWLFLPLLIGFFFLSGFFSDMFFTQMASDEAKTYMAEIQEMMAAEGFAGIMAASEELAPQSAEFMKSQIIPNAIGYFLSGAIIAFGVNKLLKTDPEANRWG